MSLKSSKKLSQQRCKSESYLNHLELIFKPLTKNTCTMTNYLIAKKSQFLYQLLTKI